MTGGYMTLLGGGIATGVIRLEDSPETIGSHFGLPSFEIQDHDIENGELFAVIHVDNPMHIEATVQDLSYHMTEVNSDIIIANGESSFTIPADGDITERLSMTFTDQYTDLALDRLLDDGSFSFLFELTYVLTLGQSDPFQGNANMEIPFEIPVPQIELLDQLLDGLDVVFDMLLENVSDFEVFINELGFDLTWSEESGGFGDSGTLGSDSITNLSLDSGDSTTEQLSVTGDNDFETAVEENDELYIQHDISTDIQSAGTSVTGDVFMEELMDV